MAHPPNPAELPASPTRGVILDAAEALFAEAGFGETALRQVAHRAGVTRSLIHHHFGSKEGLWHAVVERRFQEYARMQHAILDRPELGAGDFAESLRAMFAWLEANPKLARLHAWTNAGAGGSHPDSSGLTARGVERLRAMQKRGEIADDLDPASLLAAFFGLVEHWFQARDGLADRFGDALPEDATYLETAARLLLRGVAR